MEAVEQLPKTSCCVCDKNLSVPPVYLSEKGFTCGRCPPQGCRNEAYEELAKLLKFPCCNEGCIEKLKWGAATQHEQVCQHQIIPCPFPTCGKEFQLLAIKSHFEVEHKDSFFSKNVLDVQDFFDETFKSSKQTFLVVVVNIPVLVVVKNVWKKIEKFTEWEYNFGVFNMSTSASDIQFDIVLKFNYDDGFSSSSTLNNLNIKTFNNVSHTFTDDVFLKHKMSNIDKHSNIAVDVIVRFYGEYIDFQNDKMKQLLEERKVRESLIELINVFICDLCENEHPDIYCTEQKRFLCGICLKNCQCRFLHPQTRQRNHVFENELKGLGNAIEKLDRQADSMTIKEIIFLVGFINCRNCNNVFAGGNVYFNEFNNRYIISCRCCAGNGSLLRTVMLEKMQQPIKKLLELKGVSF